MSAEQPRPFGATVERISDWLEKNPDAVELLGWGFEHVTAKTRPGEEKDGALRRIVARLYPHNWADLSIAAHTRARQVVVESGLCLLWVPDSALVRTLISAPGKEERDEILSAERTAIFDDVEECLEIVTHPRCSNLTRAASEALGAMRADSLAAGQALSAAAIGEILEEHFGHPHFGPAERSLAQDDLAIADPRAHRAALINTCLRMAIMRTEQLGSEQRFNRHHTAHRVDPDQYTDAHAIAALMLVAGTTRELHELYSDHELGLPPIPTLARPIGLPGARRQVSAPRRLR